MLGRRDRIERLDIAIADTEVAITEHVLRISLAEAAERDATTIRRSLDTLDGVFVEYRRARRLLAEAGGLVERSRTG